ncbi:MAG: hypothetical protein PSX37_08405 [bacterium]|nr:hypothetical protein [bacterium]
MRRLVAAAVVGLIAAVMTSPPAAAEDGVSTVCRFSDDRLTEISGMALSLRHPDVIWLHNDSSGGPYIYAVDATTCQTLARVTIAGIDARDIEAIASGRDAKGRPVLWVADIGDNLDSWTDVRLHRIREPKSLVDQTVTPTTYRFTYSDRPHNAEALLVDPNSTRVWIVTKQLAHGRLYKLPKRLSPTEVNVAKPIGGEGGLVTDGSVSPDGTRYVLRDYVNATVFDDLPEGQLAETIGLPIQPQGEAVTWTADGRALLIASERDNRLLRVVVPSVAASPTAAPVPSQTATPAPTPSQSPLALTQEGDTSRVGVAAIAVGVLCAVLILVAIAAVRSRRRRGA